MSNQVSIKLVLNRGDFDKQMSDATAAFKKSIQDMQIAANVNITAGAQQSIQQLQLEIAKLTSAAKTQAAISRQAAAEANRDGTIGAATAKANAQNAATESKYRIASMSNETAQLKAQLAARTAAINADIKAQQSNENLKRAELVATSKVTAATLQLQGREAAAAAKIASAESTAQAKIAVANASLVSSESRKQASDARALLERQRADSRLTLAERKANDAAALASQKASLAAAAQAQRDASAQAAQLARDAIAQTKLQQSTVQNATAQTRLEQERVAAAAKVAAEQLKLQNAPNLQAAANAKQQLADTRANSAQLVANANITRAEILANAQLTTAGIRQQMQQQRLDARASMSDMASSIYLVKNAWAALSSVLAKPLNISDEYVRLKNKLSIVTDTALEASESLDKLMASSNRSRTAVSEVTTLYSRMHMSLEPLGKSQKDIIQIAENVSKALSLGGATASESAGSIIQLSQAFDLGKLSGQEFRSVASMMPVVAEAIRKYMGLSKGEMLAAAKAGKITAEVMSAAILSITGQLNKDFAQSGVTFSQAFNVMGNNLTDFFGKMNESIGLTQAMSKGIIWMSENLRLMAVALSAVAAGMLVAFNASLVTRIGSIRTAVTALNVALAANPLILFAAAAAAATVALIAYGDQIRLAETTTQTMAFNNQKNFITLADVGNSAAKVIADNFKQAFKVVSESIASMGSLFKSTTDQMRKDANLEAEWQGGFWDKLTTWNPLQVAGSTIAGVSASIKGTADELAEMNRLGDEIDKRFNERHPEAGFWGDSAKRKKIADEVAAEFKAAGEKSGYQFSANFWDAFKQSQGNSFVDKIVAQVVIGDKAKQAAATAAADKQLADNIEQQHKRDAAEIEASRLKEEREKDERIKHLKGYQDFNRSILELEQTKRKFSRDLAQSSLDFDLDIAERQFEANKLGIDAYLTLQLDAINKKKEANKKARDDELAALEASIADQIELTKQGGEVGIVASTKINQIEKQQIEVELKYKIADADFNKTIAKINSESEKLSKEAKEVVLQISLDFDKTQTGGYLATVEEIQKKYRERLEAIKKFAGTETFITEANQKKIDQLTKQAEIIRDQETALNNISIIEKDNALARTEIETRQADLDAKLAQGKLTQLDYDKQSYGVQLTSYALAQAELSAQLALLEPYKDSIIIQQQILDIKKKQAELEGKKPFTQQQKDGKAYFDWYNKTMEETRLTTAGIAQQMQDGFSSAFMSLIDGSKHGKEAIKDLARSFLTNIAQMISKQMALNAVVAIMGKSDGNGGTTGGLLSSIIGAFTSSPTGYAGGGHVQGAGTSTSDSIPAMLSNDEYVMPAKAVREYGVGFMDMMRDLKLPRRHFNSGGLATLSRSPAVRAYNSKSTNDNSASASPQVTITMVNNGTPQKATDQNVTYDKIKGMMITLFTDDLRNNGQMAQSINSAPSLRSTRR